MAAHSRSLRGTIYRRLSPCLITNTERRGRLPVKEIKKFSGLSDLALIISPLQGGTHQRLIQSTWVTQRFFVNTEFRDLWYSSNE